VNGQDTVNGLTCEQTKETAGVASVVTEAGACDDIDDKHDLTPTGCQPTAADFVYDLCIHGQTLLWKALPKPSNTSQVSFRHYLGRRGYGFVAVLSFGSFVCSLVWDITLAQ